MSRGTIGTIRASFFPEGGLLAQQSENAGQRGSGRVADLVQELLGHGLPVDHPAGPGGFFDREPAVGGDVGALPVTSARTGMDGVALARGVVHAQRGAGLHRRTGHAVDPRLEPHDVRGARERGLDGRALPDAAGAVERQRMAGPATGRLLDAEMGVERDHLHLGERVLVRIEEIEARLHKCPVRIGEERPHAVRGDSAIEQNALDVVVAREHP